MFCREESNLRVKTVHSCIAEEGNSYVYIYLCIHTYIYIKKI